MADGGSWRQWSPTVEPAHRPAAHVKQAATAPTDDAVAPPMRGVRPRHVIGSAVFALVYVLIPWPQMFEAARGVPMLDRATYWTQVVTHSLRVDYFSYDSWLEYVTHEYLWSAALAYTRDAGVPVEVVFNAISFTFLFFAALFVIRGARARYLILLVNPLIVDLAFSQLRLAAALSILAVALLCTRKWRLLAIVCLVVAPLVHTSSLLFIAVYVGARIARRWARREKVARAVLLLLVTGLMVSLVTGPWRTVLLEAIDDRRATYGDYSSSFAYLSFWIVLFLLLLLTARHWVTSLEAGFAFAILASVAFNLALGGYSTRFLAAAFPFMVIALARSSREFRIFGVLGFIVYAAFQWCYWFAVL